MFWKMGMNLEHHRPRPMGPGPSEVEIYICVIHGTLYK